MPTYRTGITSSQWSGECGDRTVEYENDGELMDAIRRGDWGEAWDALSVLEDGLAVTIAVEKDPHWLDVEWKCPECKGERVYRV